MTFSVLASAWLEALDLLHRLNDDMTKAESASMIARAEAAAKIVDDKFEEMKAKGEMKAIALRYRQQRTKAQEAGRRFIPWPAFLLEQKRAMVRAMAIEQRSRARRGVKF